VDEADEVQETRLSEDDEAVTNDEDDEGDDGSENEKAGEFEAREIDNGSFRRRLRTEGVGGEGIMPDEIVKI
jgi:hypothetical protein